MSLVATLVVGVATSVVTTDPRFVAMTPNGEQPAWHGQKVRLGDPMLKDLGWTAPTNPRVTDSNGSVASFAGNDASSEAADPTVHTRDRRDADACSTSADANSAVQGLLETGDAVSVRPFFDTDGTITLQWAGANRNQATKHMMLLAGASKSSKEDFFGEPTKCNDPATGDENTCNLFVSNDDGVTFVQPPTIEWMIFDIQYSRSEVFNGDDYAAFATLYDGTVTNADGNPFMYISNDGGTTFKELVTEVHFDYIIPSVLNVGRFLALDYMPSKPGQRSLYELHICTGVFAKGYGRGRNATQDKELCHSHQENIVQAQWLDHTDSSSVSYANRHWGVYYTQARLDPDTGEATGAVDLFLWVAKTQADGTLPAPVKLTPQPAEVTGLEVFHQQHNFLFVKGMPDKADTFNERGMYVKDMVGSKDGDDPATTPTSWNKAGFPSSANSKDNHYTIIDASENVVMVAVEHTYTETRGSTALDYDLGSGDSGPVSPDCKPATAGSQGRCHPASRALFAGLIDTPLQVNLVYDRNDTLGCNDKRLSLPPGIENMAVVMRRGTCKFVEKLQNAYDAGAVASIIINSADTHEILMSAPDGHVPPNVPQVILSKADGDNLIRYLISKKTLKATLHEDAYATQALYKHANLYVSGTAGASYSVSIKDVMYRTAGSAPGDPTGSASGAFVDAMKVDAVDGTYLANAWDSADSKVRTVISYDKGGFWWPLRMDQDPNSTGFNAYVTLGLSGAAASTGLPMPKSQATAPGVVMANGWHGSYPSTMAEFNQVVTFATRDGGMSWDPLDEEGGAHDFRILDHGGILALVPWNTVTDTIKFSLDEGRSVGKFKFVEDKVMNGQEKRGLSFTDTDSGARGAHIECQCVNGKCADPSRTRKYRCQSGASSEKWAVGGSPATLTIMPAAPTAPTSHKATLKTKLGGSFDGDFHDATGTLKFAEGADQKNMGVPGHIWRKPAYADGVANGVLMQGVVAEPFGSAALLYAYWFDHKTNEWFGMRVDFQRALPVSTCDINKDYESWQPGFRQKDGSQCLLGGTTVVQRRKRCNFCFNGITKENIVVRTESVCDCTVRDFKCTEGFYRNETSILSGEVKWKDDLTHVECKPDSDYWRPLCADNPNPDPRVRYERVAGDSCNPTAETKALLASMESTDACGPKHQGSKKGSSKKGSSKKGSGGTVAAVVIVLLLVLGGGGVFLAKRNAGGGGLSISAMGNRYQPVGAADDDDFDDDDDDDAGIE